MFWAEIDESDAHLVEDRVWHAKAANKTVYAVSKYGGYHQQMHRVIMGYGKGDARLVNHIDGNGLNNKRSNLEESNHMHNAQSWRQKNSSRSVGSVFQMKEYVEHGHPKSWRAMITINKKRYQKGCVSEQEGRDWITALLHEQGVDGV